MGIEITYGDRCSTYAIGITPQEVAREVAQGEDGVPVEGGILAASFNDVVIELTRPLTTDGVLSLISWDSAEGRQVLWHSSAHLLAEALEALYPGVHFGIGPAIAHGFYYDVDFGDQVFGEKDLVAVEKKMVSLAKGCSPYARRVVPYDEAVAYFAEKGDPYKTALLGDLKDQEVTFYTQGNFTDLCRGPHIPHTGWVKAIKLLSIAGAYWRGDQQAQQLTRIYGVSFPNKAALKAHLQLLEEAAAYDHRKLGKKLSLFHFSPRVGIGLPLWLPKGTQLKELLQGFIAQRQQQQGYQTISTPHIGHKDLYETSGHYQKYGEDSFQPIETPDGDTFLLKPMNCPHHCEVFACMPRSYKELPLRFAEFGTVYRYEQSGELHGLTRVRGFTQDDAHIFCTQEQVKGEFIQVIRLMMGIFQALDLTDYKAQLSFRSLDSNKYIGDPLLWDEAERDIEEAAQTEGLPAKLVRGEAAFYGPKLDFMVQDALGRSWQLGTIQLDYQLPKRFDLSYIGHDNQKHCPVMIHRALFGSIERFVALLLEHHKGSLPLSLSPVQVGIVPVSDKFVSYASDVSARLKGEGFRVELDLRDERVGRKIRDLVLQRTPLVLVLGEKESTDGTVSVRSREEEALVSLTLDAFIAEYKAASILT